jgi:pilus assembly protein CpaC
MSFRQFALVALVSIVSLFASQAAAAEPVSRTEEMSLSVGENRTISALDVKSFSEGLAGIAEVKVTPGGSQFVIVGQKPGSTTLLLIKRDGQEVVWKINVFPQPVHVVESELSELLGDTTGIRVRRVGARFFIEGGVTTEPELHRIDHIAGLYPGQVESLVVLGGVAADRKINIRVDLFFVQYSKARSLQIGMNYPTSYGGAAIQTSFVYDFLAKATTAAQAALVNQPMPGLDLAASNGWVKVLKHATLITSNGSEAEFSNGGAQWYPANNGLTSTLREIPFGTTMKILPRFDPKSSEMNVRVGADVADLVPPITSGTDLPGQNTSKLATSVAMKLGQSIVLSGIRTHSQRHNTRGIPWLNEIPILGALFGSIGKQQEELEGAVFIIPSVVEGVTQRSSELVSQALDQYGNFAGDMKSVEPSPPAPFMQPQPRGEKTP